MYLNTLGVIATATLFAAPSFAKPQFTRSKQATSPVSITQPTVQSAGW